MLADQHQERRAGQGERARVSYKLSYSFDNVNKTVPLQRRYGQGSGGVFDATFPGSWGPDLQASGTSTYDHADEMFESGHKFENNLSISGGNDRTTYYLSLGRTDIDGVIKGNSDYIRNTFRVKASQLVADRMRVTGNVSVATVESNRIQKGKGDKSGLLILRKISPDLCRSFWRVDL